MAETLSEFTAGLKVAMVDNSRYPILAGEPMPTQMVDEMNDSMERLADPIYQMVLSFALDPQSLQPIYKVKTDLEDPLAGFLSSKIDDDTIKINYNTRRLYVDRIPTAGPDDPGGVTIGAQPFLYLNQTDLMLNAETSPTLVGGDEMVPTSRAVKVYVDSAISSINGGGGIGDMLKSTYDTNTSGVVDDSERLGNQLPSYYLAWSNFTGLPTTIAGYGITDAYTISQIDGFFEGESVGKKQVDWTNITNTPSLIAISGVPTANQVAIWSSATDLKGEDTLSLDYIAPPTTNWSMALDSKQLKFTWVAPTTANGAMELEATGAFTGSLLHLHQHTGNPGSGTYLLYLDSEDVDVLPLSINAAGTYSAEFNKPLKLDDIYEYSTDAGVTLNNEFYLPNITGSGSGTPILYFNKTTGQVTYGDQPGTGGSALVEEATLIDNSITYVVIGDTSTDTGIKILYSLQRGTDYQAGQITVLYKGGTSVNIDYDYFPSGGLGVIFQADISGTDIRLKCTLTSTGNNADFKYIKEYRGGYNQWIGEGSPSKVVTLPSGTTTKFLVGNTNHHRSVKILYAIQRATDYQVGEIWLLNKGGTLEVPSPYYSGDDCGITFTGEINNDNILLNISEEVGDNGYFEYRILYPDGSREWVEPGGLHALTASLTDASQTDIIIGNTKDSRAFKVFYDIIRGTQYQTGEIYIVHNDTSIIGNIDWSYIGDSPGVNIGANIVNNQVQLNITLTSTGTGATFNYEVVTLDTILTGGTTTNYYLSAVDASDINAVDFTITGGTDVLNVDFGHDLDVHDNITLTTLTTDDILKWSGTAWVNTPIPTLTNYWQKNGTNIQPATSGDDILLATGSERILFGDSNTYISEDSSDNLLIVINNNTYLQFNNGVNTTHVNLVPNTSGLDLGSITTPFKNLFLGDYLMMTEITAPTNPTVNTGKLYPDTADAGKLKWVFNDAGAITTHDLTFSSDADVKWGSISTGNLVLGNGTTIDINSGLSFTDSSSTLSIDGTTGGELTLLYNSVSVLELFSTSGGYAYINPTNAGLFITPNNTGGHIAIGSTAHSDTFLFIQDNNVTPLANSFQLRSKAGNQIVNIDSSEDIFFPAISLNEADSYMVTINNITGKIAKKSISSIGGGNVSWGSLSGTQPLVFGTDGGDISSNNNITWSGSSLALNNVTGSSISLSYNSTPELSLQTFSNNSRLYFNTKLYLYGSGSNPQIGLGNTMGVNSWVTIKDFDTTTPYTNTLEILNSGTNTTFKVENDGDVYMPQLTADEAEDYLIAIDNTTGLLSKRSVTSVSGGVTLGVQSQIPYMNATDDDFNYTSNFIFDQASSTVILDGTTGSFLQLKYNGGLLFQLFTTSGAGYISSPENLYINSTSATDPRIALGDYLDSDSFLTIRETHNPENSIIKVYNKSTELALDIKEDKSIIVPGLSIDNTEDYLVAIDNTTGLLTKRAVSSISSGGGYWDRTGTILSPATAGDDIRLQSTELISWGDGDTYMNESSDDNLQIITAGGVAGSGAEFTWDLDSFTINHSTQPQLVLRYNSTPTFSIQGGASATFISASVGTLYLAATEVTEPHVVIGSYNSPTSFLTIRESHNSLTSTVQVINAGGTKTFDIYEGGSVYIPQLGSDDTEGHIVAIDDTTGLLTKRSVNSMPGGYWSKNGNDLSPSDTNNEILMPTGYGIKFGDGDSYIYEASDDNLRFICGASVAINLTATLAIFQGDIRPDITDNNNIGSPTLYWNNLYIGNIYLNDSNIIKSPDGVNTSVNGKDLNLQAGDPYNSVGADAGAIILKAGDARFGDSTSVVGGIYLDPGNAYATNSVPEIRIGSSTNNSGALGITAEGSDTDVDLHISGKNSGWVRLVAEDIGFYNTTLIHSTNLVTLRSSSNYDFLLNSGNANTSTNNDGRYLKLKAGAGDGTGDGGDLYLVPGTKGTTGVNGGLYIGEGSGGLLDEDTGPTYVLVYNPTTGQIKYADKANL